MAENAPFPWKKGLPHHGSIFCRGDIPGTQAFSVLVWSYVTSADRHLRIQGPAMGTKASIKAEGQGMVDLGSNVLL